MVFSIGTATEEAPFEQKQNQNGTDAVYCSRCCVLFFVMESCLSLFDFSRFHWPDRRQSSYYCVSIESRRLIDGSAEYNIKEGVRNKLYLNNTNNKTYIPTKVQPWDIYSSLQNKEGKQRRGNPICFLNILVNYIQAHFPTCLVFHEWHHHLARSFSQAFSCCGEYFWPPSKAWDFSVSSPAWRGLLDGTCTPRAAHSAHVIINPWSYVPPSGEKHR